MPSSSPRLSVSTTRSSGRTRPTCMRCCAPPSKATSRGPPGIRSQSRTSGSRFRARCIEAMRAANLAFAVALVASAAALASVLIYVLRPLLLRYLLAHPNARSSHTQATPQGAGVGVIIALLIICAAAWLLWQAPVGAMALVPTLAAALGLMVLGLADDAHALPVSWRFIGQTLAALGMVWLVNAVNFLDGLDWITAAQVVPMTLGVAVLAGLNAVPASVGFLALVLLGAMLGFAPFNKHPAKVFLGDAGSLPIGLLLAFMLIYVAGTAPPQVTARIFLLGSLLASLAIAAVILDSTIADIVLLGLGAVATGCVLHVLARGAR